MSTLEFGCVHLLRNLCHPTTQKEAICKEKATTKDTLHICIVDYAHRISRRAMQKLHAIRLVVN
jgi:DNA transposition AAA+ family ATPase